MLRNEISPGHFRPLKGNRSEALLQKEALYLLCEAKETHKRCYRAAEWPFQHFPQSTLARDDYGSLMF